MNIDNILDKALNRVSLTLEEATYLYKNGNITDLVFIADTIRKRLHPEGEVGWIIDRNVNINNACISGCKFCNFHCRVGDEREFTTSMEEYVQKIDEMTALGGDQLLLQGGMHPKYGIEFYIELFSSIRERYPSVKLHALGPPEIVHIARKSRLSYRDTLIKLMDAGLSSLPGAGAEILSDRVRKELSPGKAKTSEWLAVMEETHKLNMVTSATMMFGHIETIEERVSHLIKLRDLQSKRPEGSQGFAAFIAWPVIANGTVLESNYNLSPSTPLEYIRLIAMSRIVLNNIDNIQASWLTVGKKIGQMALNAGANDMGSIMIEENVVASVGMNNSMDSNAIQKAIIEAGFKPYRRDQAYNHYCEKE